MYMWINAVNSYIYIYIYALCIYIKYILYVEVSIHTLGAYPSMLRFRAACERAYDGALQLAAWCGGYEVSFLQKYYEQSCGNDWFSHMAQSAPGGADDECSDEEDLPEESLAKVRKFVAEESFF